MHWGSGNRYIIFIGTPQGKREFERLDIDGKIILK
jgi:hypothetical protein